MGESESQIGAISAHRIGATPPKEIVVGEADYYCKPELTLPQQGLTVMYGHRGAASVVSSMVREAKGGSRVALVEFRVSIGQWNPNKQKLADFESSRFLNLPSRASAPVLDDINRHWNEWLALEGKPEERFPRRPSMNMHLLDKLVELEPYNHLTAIAYEVVTEVGIARFMTIFDVEAIDLDSVVVGPDIEAEVVFEV